jgi:1-acyl-sn-glycerol-3-phosphate acyltransferase
MKSYDHNVHSVADNVHDFFYTTYNKIHICGPSIDLDSFKNSGIMIASTHRSMTDYYLLGMLMHELGIRNLRFAAGDNLTKLPIIGSKFKGFGSFSVERDTAFNRDYFKKLCDRIVTMLEDNDNIVVFPEGGRSYKGNMMELKRGVLSAAFVAQARDQQKKFYILPISFSYERLYELPFFKLLEKGKNLRKRTNPILKQWLGSAYYFGADIFAYLRLHYQYKLKRKQGDIFIDYGKPISVNELVEVKPISPEQIGDELFAYKNALQALGNAVRQKLLELYRLLPAHVMAYCLNNQPTRLLTELQKTIRTIVGQLIQQNRNIKTLQPLTDGEILENGLRQLSFYKAILVKDGVVRILKPWIIDYYAASIEKA